METEKDYIDRIEDELMNLSLSKDQQELKEWDEKCSDRNQFYMLLTQIGVSADVTAMGEELKEEIHTQINLRIQRVSRRFLWLKIAAIAASVALLLGMKSSLILPDGTKVIMNAGATLSYPTAFVSKNREVQVSGEAFFEVAHDTQHPFIVKSENLNICVLGTKFNVKAYKEEDNIEVTLMEGRVGVNLNTYDRRNMVYLKPGQQLLFDKTRLSFCKQSVNLNNYISWKDGKYYFNSLTFVEIAMQLERNFNVHINIESSVLRKIVFTGDFVRGENLEQILRVMTADRRTHYKIEGDQVSIYDK